MSKRAMTKGAPALPAPWLLATAAMCLAARATGAAGEAASPVHYVLDQAKSTLEFTFMQAGAQNKGKFTRFPVTFDFPPESPAGGHLEVTVEMGSLDTGDKERDDTLRTPDLFSVAKFPQARFSATQITKTSVRRLDFGVGQGDWKATDQVGNEVGVAFALRLTGAAR